MIMQPIETAPKDGTEIFIWREGWDAAYIAKWDVIERHVECGDGETADLVGWILRDEFASVGVGEGVLGWQEDIDDGSMPTHWFPLPDETS